MANAPAKIGRSNTFTARPFSSPQSSPLVSRHASFNTAGDHSPRTFRTFLGDRESRKRTSLSSSSCSSTSSQSPSSTIDSTNQNSVFKYSNVNHSQEPATKTSESDNETSSVMPRKVSRRSTAPEHHRRSRSLDGQEVKPPPWRSRTPGGVSTFKKDSGISNGLSYPDYIRSKCYQGESAISDANADVIELIKMLSKTLDSFSSPAKLTNTDSGIFQKNKDALVAESRQFVTDSKMLVSSATHSKEKLVQNVNNSIHTLATLTHLCQITMATMTSLPLAIALGSKVKDVANAYKTTVNAAHNAAGMPLSDPNMKMLMRQATALAAVLSTFMKTLKTLDFTP
ncbi:hypothetical protein CAPTEDRAFT_175436 [Capitella teleta]|uniref:Uncharacterized protein n=1 Tax=Capitella teleta TaxID=283909 RepID=R7UN22_CAPTE|nr:hypothetical protein CAPTEDRAFT_175436 [Capitella teleta]|eukprot:ELU07590.1 hypothetical protein CAPTEDRAFT_175436 [Capitella teleta]